MLNRKVVNIIGSGLAGIEAALFLAGHDVKVHVFGNGKVYKDDFQPAKTLSAELYDKILTQELCLLGSPLARKKAQLEKENANCVDQLLVSYGLNMINDNENIEVFDASVRTINPLELTIVATGHKTEEQLFQHLIDKYGTMKCVNALPVYPIIDGIDEVFLFDKGDGTYLLSLSEVEYVVLVKEIIKHAFEQRKSVEDFKLYQNTIEDLALHYKENLRTYSMKPQRTIDGLKPYATIVLRKCDEGFIIENISSNLPQNRQLQIFRCIKAFANCRIVKPAGITKGKFINPIHTTTQFCQSVQDGNIFFAGGILGIDGTLNGIASGIWTAMNVLKKVENKRMVSVPQGCVFGKFIHKLTSDTSTRTRPLINYDDIIEIDERQDVDKFVDACFEKSLTALEQFKEEYKNGKYV